MHPLKCREVLIRYDMPSDRRRFRSMNQEPSRSRNSYPQRAKRSKTVNGRVRRDRSDDYLYVPRQSRRNQVPDDHSIPRRHLSRDRYFEPRNRSSSAYRDSGVELYPRGHDDGRYSLSEGRHPEMNKFSHGPSRRHLSRESLDGHRYHQSRNASCGSPDGNRFERNRFDRSPSDGVHRFKYASGRYDGRPEEGEIPRSKSGDRFTRYQPGHDQWYTPRYLRRDFSGSPNRYSFDRTRETSIDRKRNYVPDFHERDVSRGGSWVDVRDSDYHRDRYPYEERSSTMKPKEFRPVTQDSRRRSESLPPRRHQNLEKDEEYNDYRGEKTIYRQQRKTDDFETPLKSHRMSAPVHVFSDVSPDKNTQDHEKARKESDVPEAAIRSTHDFVTPRFYKRASDPLENVSSLHCGVEGDSSGEQNVFEDVLRVDAIDFEALENAKSHRTYEYDLAKDAHQPTPVLRRGKTFMMNLSFKDRPFNESSDLVFLNFYTGPNPTVPKHTRVVLPVKPGMQFQRGPHQWDARVLTTKGNSMAIEVNVPVSCPVGIWHGVLETAIKKASSYRLQYRCVDDVYIIFNPFHRDDPVYMESDEQRFEYVINDCGKIFTGEYRNVIGRPWIYGQFDQCVLPAACILLEMSGLAHADRANPVKVTRALASMIRASGSVEKSLSWLENSQSGLIEAKLDESNENGSSPHLWTGSIQIIEEFLRNGTAPVRYGQCWVMAALMTSICRALGLPARPTTAFVYAYDSEDSLTVDRYVNNFGEILEHGPNRDQHNAIWSFHTWCDVWMSRPDHPREYSGWQATDPFRANRIIYDGTSGCIGPCPVEALRRGDVGQRNDVESFYASLNSYVRYFYEDEASRWGYTPFKQFRYPICRRILSKSVGCFDNTGDEDCDDLTSSYIDNASTDTERFRIFNTCCGLRKDTPSFEYEAKAFPGRDTHDYEADSMSPDVVFELSSAGKVAIGEEIVISLLVSNSSRTQRTIQANMCARSCYYTGITAAFLKRSSKEVTLQPNHQEIVKFVISPKSYEHELVDMAFVKIAVSAFVQETGQSFIDEIDFRLCKPLLKIEISEAKTNRETEATFSFVNPLEDTLTDFYITFEVSGCVRPDTIKIDGRVKPGETFLYKHVFVPRSSGDRRMVATFTSRQLSDVVGHAPITVLE